MASVLPPISRSIASLGLHLHVTDWGNVEAPPLILLHGGRDHGRSWDWVAARLADRFHLIAPDLRGHGDSDWSPDGDYSMAALVSDFAGLVAALDLPSAAIIGHSLGGAIALRYAALFPEKVTKLVAIEGLRPPPDAEARADAPIEARLRSWIEKRRTLSARAPVRYPSLEAAQQRMQSAHPNLSPEQARHLTEHGVRRHDDGSFSWKFDPLIRAFAPVDLTGDELHALYSAIACPTLLVYGRDSWATNPAEDGRQGHFRNARVALFEGAGHWVHHDRLEPFLAEVAAFLEPPAAVANPVSAPE